MLQVKTNALEFNNAESNGYIYGYVIRKHKFSVYINLGEEVPYNTTKTDHENTKYRLFRNCTVYYSENDDDLDKGTYIHEPKFYRLVKIFC